MADDALRHATTSSNKNNAATDSNTINSSTPSTATSSYTSAPPGNAIRRAKTVAENSPSATRRQTTTSSPTAARRFSSDSAGAFEPLRRRSSNFSNYGVNEARSTMNPHGKAAAGAHDGADQGAQELSSLAGLSLAFALLPAIAGALFKNGGAVTTDIMLLGLAGVFLHWSVTQPWIWYHSAQQVRIQHEANAADIDVFEDNDDEFADRASHLDDLPEDEAARATNIDDNSEIVSEKKPRSAAQQSALNELYLHEVMALVSCFSLPLISAFLLHMIRAQLSRPSEGLVSNYNLTIFVLVSEVRVLSHMIKLVQARTLHLQRIVHTSNPFGTAALPTDNRFRINAIMERLDALESDAAAAAALPEEPKDDDSTASARAAQEAVLAKDVRGAIQPELDALNRAVRRYEKKSTLLQSHIDAHLAAIDARVQDAIALAAVAAKNSSQSSNSLLARSFDAVITTALFPFHAVLQLILMPIRWALPLTRSGTAKKTKRGAAGCGRGSPQTAGKPPTRGARRSEPTSQPRYSGDKMPSRLARK
ncbi:hypothetical protein ISF_09926 [Cordyceps fumosorosea ARSEF 2679]|uniref:Uncharacterized protein n=1 Tax=Cordyceps fumosorosea (strain ARSEF 2679) TaxID=1081104 RepID=A0A166YU48_CORFA|nr:hypothetical protein ISF_09926 [Cordyceps fumosorosea ARSEF 2679]OAA37257.1 hypothetical protein ISF_09926 [Cordyceps fumosorosea ARSEF 2679]